MSGGVFSKLDPDIITFHILPHLDGKTLIILSSVSSQFYNLICKNSENLWRNICTSTWPSLLTPNFLINRISEFPGGYRTFFSDVFPPIHSPLNIIINPPPSICFYYSVDIFLRGQPRPFCSLHATQAINTLDIQFMPHPLVIDRSGFEFELYNPLNDFIKVKKQGYEEYLKQNLTFSCVVIKTNERKCAAGSLFTPGCKPVSVEPSWIPGWVNVVFETLLPSLPNLYTQMVICRTKVQCDWQCDTEDHKLCVKCVHSTFTDMNGKPVRNRHAVIIILNALINGERKN